MTPCHCGNVGTVYRVPNAGTLRIMDVRQCHDCRREYLDEKNCHVQPCGHATHDVWIRSGGYCPDCLKPSWRSVVHPRFGTTILLWPDPASARAYYACKTPQGDPSLTFQQYCPDCIPKLGEVPRHTVEGIVSPGVPYPVGACRKIEDARTVYAHQFSGEYGSFLRCWLSDELRLDEVEIDRLMTQWEEDRQA